MKPRSTRLNANNRDVFIKEVMDNHLPDDKRPSEEAFKDRWKDKIYEIVYGPYKERMDALPEWFFPKSEIMKVGFKTAAGDDRILRFVLPSEQKILNPHTEYGYGYRADRVTTEVPAPEDHPVSREFAQLAQDMADYTKKQRALRKQLNELVYSCNTSGQLYVAWPEALEYSHCFPYVGPKKHEGANVSATEMDVSLKLSKATIKLPDTE